MDESRVKSVQNKVRMLVEQLVSQYPEYTGKLILNFHRGNMSEKVTMEFEMPKIEIVASAN